jgi:predicted acyl esterase
MGVLYRYVQAFRCPRWTPSHSRVPQNDFWRVCWATGYENIVAMLSRHPLYDDYWEAKRIPVEDIDNIPMYMLASYSSMLHTNGSFQTFREAKTPTKWLRVHPYQKCKLAYN